MTQPARLFASVLLMVSSLGLAGDGTAPTVSRWPNLETIRDLRLAKVHYSNFVTLRPGSLYELSVQFEQNSGFPRPTFNYFFMDTGLGAAEPLYPVFQSGYQASWAQLLSAATSEKRRHIDHFSDMTTPEGCRVRSVYIIRHIDDFPELYAEERAQGYDLVDISWDHTTRLKPDAQCGRHRSEAPDPSFDPFEALKPYLDGFVSMDQIPSALLSRFEAKVNLLKPIQTVTSSALEPKGWKTYAETYTARDNSLWYYPSAHAPDYGIDAPRPQPGLPKLSLPRHLFYAADERLRAAAPLAQALSARDQHALFELMRGRPNGAGPAARAGAGSSLPDAEPGDDAFGLDQISSRHVLTEGLHVIAITDPASVAARVADPAGYTLVAAIVRPAEDEARSQAQARSGAKADPHRLPAGERIPELRLVYQWGEQAFIHLTWEAIDRKAPPAERARQGAEFLRRVDAVAAARDADPATGSVATAELVRSLLRSRPAQSAAFSSSLTGRWAFGRVLRSPDGAFAAERIVRHGIDYGYYSSAYDNELLRAAISTATGARKAQLEQALDDLTPRFYRDPRRMDAERITFNGVTCAQCHQTSARDGVHVQLNDGLDRRLTLPAFATEYVYRELDRQLKLRSR